MLISAPRQIILGSGFAQLRVLRNDGICWGRVVHPSGVNEDVAMSSEVDLYDLEDDLASSRMELMLHTGQAVLVNPLSTHHFDWVSDIATQGHAVVLQVQGLATLPASGHSGGLQNLSPVIAQRCNALQVYFDAGWECTSEDMQTVGLPNDWQCCVIRVEDPRTPSGESYSLGVLDPRGVDFGEERSFPTEQQAKDAALLYAASLISHEGLMPGDPWPQQQHPTRQAMR